MRAKHETSLGSTVSSKRLDKLASRPTKNRHSPIIGIGERHFRGRGHKARHTRCTQLSSTPPTRTAILSGNGETSELVIGGTAARPCSDEVCASMVRRLFDSVAAIFLSNCWRSAEGPIVKRKSRREKYVLGYIPWSDLGCRISALMILCCCFAWIRGTSRR